MLLDFKQCQNIVQKYGLPLVESYVVETEEELVKALSLTGFPVVMKTDSKEIVHKSDEGGVILNIKNQEEAKKVLIDLLKLGKDKVVVQKQVKGEEVIIGAKKDAVFGPVVMVGLGGILVEVYKDIVFRLAPVDKKEALEMIEDIAGKIILEGYRGKRVVNKEELAQIIVKTAELISKETEIKELDFNPIMAGEESLICDVRIII